MGNCCRYFFALWQGARGDVMAGGCDGGARAVER